MTNCTKNIVVPASVAANKEDPWRCPVPWTVLIACSKPGGVIESSGKLERKDCCYPLLLCYLRSFSRTAAFEMLSIQVLVDEGLMAYLVLRWVGIASYPCSAF